MWRVVEERFHPLLIQFLPVGAVSRLLEPIRVEYLLELMAHGDGQIRLAQVKCLGHQRKSGVRNNAARTDQIREEAVERRLLKGDIPFGPVTPESVCDKPATD